jgi:hypothetical protein
LATGPVTAVVFEGGGRPGTPLEGDVRAVRQAVALDTLERLVGLRRDGDLDEVVLVTDRPGLAAAAADLGVDVEDSGPPGAPFQFGRFLQGLVSARRVGGAIVLGGGALPLMDAGGFRAVARILREQERVVVLNNPMSPDLVAFAPAAAVRSAPASETDNELGEILQRQGLRRVLLEPGPEVAFDLDTPADCAILAGEPDIGHRAAEALRRFPWVGRLVERVDAVGAVLGGELGELALAGRVGPPVTTHINSHLRVRLRVFSEERGMRALGRQRRGEVVSLLGCFIDDLGPSRFFAHLARVADAALLDWRVLLAHWKSPAAEGERFAADVGAMEAVTDPRLAAFAAAAWEAPLPVVLGGHNLVHGGLWLLAERARRRAAAPVV